jgi:hypothetical protein
MLDKMLQYENTYSKNYRLFYALEMHITCYMIALAFLGKIDQNIDKKIILIKRMNRSSLEKQLKIYKYFLVNFKTSEDEIIFNCLKKLEEMRLNDSSGDFGSMYQEGTLGMLAYEFQAGE